MAIQWAIIKANLVFGQAHFFIDGSRREKNENLLTGIYVCDSIIIS